jgi:hypothetical protein
MRQCLEQTFFAISVIVLLSCLSIAQSEYSAPFSAFGIAIKASLLGVGAEAAVPVLPHINLRSGFNEFGYDRTFHKDGVDYAGQLQFRSAETHVDWFPFHGSFHVSPGVLIYNGNQITANASVPGGQSFTLNGTSYTSDPSDPVIGTGKISFNKTGPMLSLGFGNLVPRHHRFSVPVEIGAIYTRPPNMALNLTGSACDSTGLYCNSIPSDPSIQANVEAESAKIQKDMSSFKFYPVISIGFGVKI